MDDKSFEEKVSQEQGEQIITWIIWIKIFSPVSSFKQYYEITKYFKKEHRINRDFSMYYLPRTKDGEYFINVDDKQSEGTHWVSLFIDKTTVVYFNSFRIEYIS